MKGKLLFVVGGIAIFVFSAYFAYLSAGVINVAVNSDAYKNNVGNMQIRYNRPNANNLTSNDVFVSVDFAPLINQGDFSSSETLFHDGILVPNYLATSRRNRNDSIQPYQTLLYVTHTNKYDEHRFVVYGFTYGFAFDETLQADDLENARNIYLGYFHSLLEALSVEDLELSVETSLKNALYDLRMFVNEQMGTNGINMFLSHFLIAPHWNLLDYYPNNRFFSRDFNIFVIENGISQPAANVTILEDSDSFLSIEID